ncbi:hypothetical protein KKF34_10415 [Myxococcota bacterium]|nr:hypothetical protein [Myxococcota bacterium]MBU1380508.1 hypothetical protein [Myxococcota bacterium]MBU1497279.1 hypothetical protein [Myxococcota bacterium]
MYKLAIIIIIALTSACDWDSSGNNSNNTNNINNTNNSNTNNINNTNNSNTNNINNTNNSNTNNINNTNNSNTNNTNNTNNSNNTQGPLSFTVLTYNIGNPDTEDPNYPLRMSSQSYEDYIGSVIRAMEPDIVVLQEVLSGKTCDVFTEINPNLTCYDWDTRERPARRILGGSYSIVCDQREQVECIGIKRSFGQIVGVPDGDYVDAGAYTPSLPLPGCNWAAGGCSNDLCDDESTVSAITVNTSHGPFRVVHMHPMAQIGLTAAGDPCRALQMRQVFEDDIVPGEDGLVLPSDTAVILGDWNIALEVYGLRTILQPSDADDVWNQYIGCPSCDFIDHDPRDQGGNRYSTTSNMSELGQIIAIDHVVTSTNISGNCTVFDEGGDPSTEPLDSGYSDLGNLGTDRRIDHYGISCSFTLEQ